MIAQMDRPQHGRVRFHIDRGNRRTARAVWVALRDLDRSVRADYDGGVWRVARERYVDIRLMLLRLPFISAVDTWVWVAEMSHCTVACRLARPGTVHLCECICLGDGHGADYDPTRDRVVADDGQGSGGLIVATDHAGYARYRSILGTNRDGHAAVLTTRVP
jgi:hypothetical protein